MWEAAFQGATQKAVGAALTPPGSSATGGRVGDSVFGAVNVARRGAASAVPEVVAGNGYLPIVILACGAAVLFLRTHK